MYSRMPRVKQKASRSFKELCLESISSNIDRLWCREFLENFYGKAHYLFVLGRWEQSDWYWTTCCPPESLKKKQVLNNLIWTFFRSLWWSASKLDPWCLVSSEREEVTEEASLLPFDLSLPENPQLSPLWWEPGPMLTVGSAEMLQVRGTRSIS